LLITCEVTYDFFWRPQAMSRGRSLCAGVRAQWTRAKIGPCGVGLRTSTLRVDGRATAVNHDSFLRASPARATDAPISLPPSTRGAAARGDDVIRLSRDCNSIAPRPRKTRGGRRYLMRQDACARRTVIDPIGSILPNHRHQLAPEIDHRDGHRPPRFSPSAWGRLDRRLGRCNESERHKEC